LRAGNGGIDRASPRFTLAGRNGSRGEHPGKPRYVDVGESLHLLRPERGPGAPVGLRAGLGSRRVSEDLIAEGRVKVNGEVAELGRRVDVVHDRIEVDGALIGVAPGLVYYLLNKPTGVVTTADDPHSG